MRLPKNKNATAALPVIPLPENLLLRGLLAWLAVVWIWSAVAPFNRFDWLLENLLVFGLAVAFWRYRRQLPFSQLSYVLLAVFLTMHLVGAHYTYAETPLGFWFKDALHWQRNHYDRFVHFGFGLLWAYPIYEWLRRSAKVGAGWAPFLALTIVSACSAFYEVAETMVALVVSPELGDAYLGTQGDIWDAQWDMFLAIAGAMMTLGVAGGMRAVK